MEPSQSQARNRLLLLAEYTGTYYGRSPIWASAELGISTWGLRKYRMLPINRRVGDVGSSCLAQYLAWLPRATLKRV